MAVEARAQKRSIQSSPRKMRIVLDMIRGKRVSEALSILHFTPNHASDIAEKTLRSAIANFQQVPENARFDVEDLYIRGCFADGGTMLKRVLPAPQGRAYRVRKRSNHLTIVVGEQPVGKKLDRREKKAAAAQAPAAPAKPARAPRKKAASSKKATAKATAETSQVA